MERYSRADVHDKVAQIRKWYGADIDVNFCSPAGKSLGQITVMSTGDLLSSRMTIALLIEWLDGFCKAITLMGFTQLLDAAHTLAKNEEVLESWPGECIECLTIVNDTYDKVRRIKHNG